MISHSGSVGEMLGSTEVLLAIGASICISKANQQGISAFYGTSLWLGKGYFNDEYRTSCHDLLHANRVAQ